MIFYGNAKDNVINGTVNNDVMFGSAGDDTLDGGRGNDTADYSRLRMGISLISNGEVLKGADGAYGTDTLRNMETVIGSRDFVDTIDGQTSSIGNGRYVKIDLGANVAVVDISPPGVVVSQTIVNFDNVIGSGKSDFIKGASYGANANNLLTGEGGNDTLVGSHGRDSLDGGEGFDTTDYSDLGGVVTLKAAGLIEKGEGGALGTDTIANFERIIGDAGEDNVIDGTIPGGGPASFTINLATGSLGVGGVATFETANFVDVIGTANADRVTGSRAGNDLSGRDGNDNLSGLAGNDQLDGDQGNDILSGGTGHDTLSGGLGRDKLSGGAGGDFFDFNTAADSAFKSGDVITDFAAGADTLDFSEISSQSFAYVGGGRFIANNGIIEVRYNASLDRIELDTSDNGAFGVGDMEVNGLTVAPVAGDFLF